ncbi:MAG: hypothetical protein Q8M15_00720 [Bacteroidota bacterium]|nr:hypothetical protein [Bacteroidota bacterium]
MRKPVSILVSLLILIYSGGFSLSFDNCLNQQTITIGAHNEKSCCGDIPCKEDCCNKTVIVLKKLQDKYNPPSQINNSSVQNLIVFIYSELNFSAENHLNQGPAYLTDKAPPDRQLSLNILYRTFLI